MRQINVLVRKPFSNYVPTPGPSSLIVIDALDTCGHLHEAEVARDIARSIQALASLSWRVKIFITSRFTPEIQPIYETPDFPRFHAIKLPHKSSTSRAQNTVIPRSPSLQGAYGYLDLNLSLI
jgi:hypothetical protein